MSSTGGIYLLLGTNLGDRFSNLQKAISLLRQKDIHPIKISSVYESEPWGIIDQPMFYNIVLKVESSLEPTHLLQVCLDTESDMGRLRIKKWGERIIDIDILYYEDEIVDQPDLIIPHPGIIVRRFTLVPLNELAPDMLHPITKKTNRELLETCKDPMGCISIDKKIIL